MGRKVWVCKVISVDEEEMEVGDDQPMRKAVSAQFHRMYGRAPSDIFSGWEPYDEALTETEKEVIRDGEERADIRAALRAYNQDNEGASALAGDEEMQKLGLLESESLL